MEIIWDNKFLHENCKKLEMSSKQYIVVKTKEISNLQGLSLPLRLRKNFYIKFNDNGLTTFIFAKSEAAIYDHFIDVNITPILNNEYEFSCSVFSNTKMENVEIIVGDNKLPMLFSNNTFTQKFDIRDIALDDGTYDIKLSMMFNVGGESITTIRNIMSKKRISISEEGTIKTIIDKKIKKKVPFVRGIGKIVYGVIGNDNWLELIKLKKRFYKYSPNQYFVDNYGKKPIIKDTFLVEGFNGREISGNILQICQELSNRNANLTISVNDVSKGTNLAKKYNINCSFVKTNSREYMEKFLLSEYLITDTTFSPSLFKSENQKMINCWHGTPLKAMGKDVGNDPLAFANVQRIFYQCDKIIVGNQFTKDIIAESYIMNGIKESNLYVGPNPKNSILLTSKKSLKKEKIKILWCPTWRGVGNNPSSAIALEKNFKIFQRMDEIAKSLPENFEFYVKPHSFLVENFDLSTFSLKVIDEDVYYFMRDVDILISDYSSIMFDFAVTNRKVILDIHDIDDYLDDRGLLLDIHELPFDKVNTKKELLDAIINVEYSDYSKLNSDFNSFDSNDGASKFIDIMLENNNTVLPDDSREKILIYPGSLLNNGITSAFLNLLSNLDREKYNFIIFIPKNYLGYNSNYAVNMIYNMGFDYIASPGYPAMKLSEYKSYMKLINRLKISTKEEIMVDQMFERERKRIFDDIKFDQFIHFSGYDAYSALLFKNADIKKHIFIQSDMYEEYKTRNNFNIEVLNKFYKNANTIDAISNGILEATKSKLLTEPIYVEKLNVCFNAIDISKNIERSNEIIEIDNKLMEILENKKIKKFINVARFSPEKSLDRLVNAFNLACNETKNEMALIIIGSYGPEYDKVVNLSKSNPNIFILSNINPMPIIKKCDLFVLSSFYEGVPMVFYEAASLGIPILSTRMPGPEQLLSYGVGKFCDNSVDGIKNGIVSFINDEYTFDKNGIEKYKNDANKMFLNLLERDV